MGARRRARECALQMLFAADVTERFDEEAVDEFWQNLVENESDHSSREFADKLAKGTRERVQKVDETITTRADHWRIERMAIVDRNILRLAVNEFLFEDTPHTVIINEALEIARCYSSFEATQFINGILDAIKRDLVAHDPEREVGDEEKPEDEVIVEEAKEDDPPVEKVTEEVSNEEEAAGSVEKVTEEVASVEAEAVPETEKKTETGEKTRATSR